MRVSDLITVVREDYTQDTESEAYLWSDASLRRKFTEAERQACNRANLIYDDSIVAYTRITLVSGRASYDIDPKVTTIESIRFDGDIITQKTREELDILQPTWRTDTGMADKTLYAVIAGRKLRFNYIPDADDDGDYVSLEVYRLPENDILSAEQEPEIPAEYHRDLIWWVLHECYAKKDAETFDPNKALEYLATFNGIFGEPVPAKVRQHQFENARTTTIRPIAYATATTTVTDFDYDT